MTKYIKLEKSTNRIKLAGDSALFADKTCVLSFDNKSDITIDELIKRFPGIKITIELPTNSSFMAAADAIANSPEVLPVDSTRKLENVKTASTEASFKYSAKDIPGNMALLRDEKTQKIYIGYRKHEYSYKNVCCVTPDIAMKFIYDVATTAVSTTQTTKTGKRLNGVDSRDPVIHERWMNYMDTMYNSAVRSQMN